MGSCLSIKSNENNQNVTGFIIKTTTDLRTVELFVVYVQYASSDAFLSWSLEYALYNAGYSDFCIKAICLETVLETILKLTIYIMPFFYQLILYLRIDCHCS